MSEKTPSLSPSRIRVLRLIDGASIREIARAFGGVSPNAIHQHLRKARADGFAETDGSRGGWRLTRRGESILRALRSVGI